MSASGVTPEAVSSDRSISARKIFVSAATAAGRSARMPRNRFGTEITHCRTRESCRFGHQFDAGESVHAVLASGERHVASARRTNLKNRPAKTRRQ
jgi:hypothetical protein